MNYFYYWLTNSDFLAILQRRAENGKKNKKTIEWGRDIIDKTGNALSDQLTKGAVDIVDELAPEIFAKVKRSIKNKIWPQDSNSSSLNTVM